MNNFKLSTIALLLGMVLLSSCEDDEVALDPVVSNTYSNLHAAQTTDYSVSPPAVSGDYVRFNFSTGQITSGDDWDVAFRGTTILVNGGTASADDQPTRSAAAAAYIATGTLATITDVVETNFTQDGTDGYAIPTGSDNGWYNYAGPPTHLISPIAGKVIVIKTHDNRYAKMEILSYYQDAPANPDGTQESQYYTFDYVYQPNEDVNEF